MANYNSLKATIDANVKQNGNQEITGQILNSVLNQMVTTLGAGYQFAGVATTATNPGSPDAKMFYIANGKGTYTNFGGVEVTEDDVVVLYWDSSWHKVSTGIASQEKLSELQDRVFENESLLGKIKETPTLEIIEGEYIAKSGSLRPLASYGYSKPIFVHAGSFIEATVDGTAGASAAIALCSSEVSTTFTPVVLADQTNVLKTYYYIVVDDTYLSICGEKSTLSLNVLSSSLQQEIDLTTNDGAELLVETNVEQHKYIDSSGKIFTFDSFNLTDYIKLPRGVKFKIANVLKDEASLVFYDKDKNVTRGISGASVTGQTFVEIEMAENECYIRSSIFIPKQPDGYLHILFGEDVSKKDMFLSIMAIESDSPTTNVGFSNILAAYNNIVCVGDSLTYSQVYTGTSANRQARRTYPQVLASLCGNEQMTLAKSGATALSCWNEFGSQVIAKTNPLAIIYLGTNYGVTDTLDTDVVGDNPDNWANNNVGCYCRFVQKFQSLGYKVLLLRIWATSGTGDSDLAHTNSAINHIAIRFGCAVMDVPKTSALEYHYYPDLSGYNGVHYNDLGYSWFASKLIEEIGRLPTEQMKLIIPNA